jgi:hypothetical protein
MARLDQAIDVQFLSSILIGFAARIIGGDFAAPLVTW